ncbi:Curli assembly protein CsgE [Lutibacter oceani]|uniref:Curli production assembly/transport component CsgE n=1 Tax=Lutibacter oceani TaxID=1853311 RepID=A0A3D9RT22_9FLAO|nr:CsgE family curli-type amyloid fiber assembly protein [Lutibacter oceani]REE80266.1 Curli assembly protein CsgE [Lutibacter oceani]
MKKFKISILIFIILLNGMFVYAQENIKAKIITQTADNLIDIKGIAQNEDVTYKEGLSYLLFSLKKGIEGNYSKNSQSGEFSLNPNEEKELSKLKINVQKGEICKVFLFIKKNDELISKDSTIIQSAEAVEIKKDVNEGDIEINGLVIEDVKTKLGKDFYDYFYQKITTSGSKYNFIINISEKPSIGVGSKISIVIDDRTIFEFMTRPDDEYIQAAANEALRYIGMYSNQRKLIYKNKKI